MNIFHTKQNKDLSTFELFMKTASEKLIKNIYRKLLSYAEINSIYSSHSLKKLNQKIWGYKGTIYKMRVDYEKESAMILFVKTPRNDIVLLNSFIKKTQKMPKKEATTAIRNLTLCKSDSELAIL